VDKSNIAQITLLGIRIVKQLHNGSDEFVDFVSTIAAERFPFTLRDSKLFVRAR